MHQMSRALFAACLMAGVSVAQSVTAQDSLLPEPLERDEISLSTPPLELPTLQEPDESRTPTFEGSLLEFEVAEDDPNNDWQLFREGRMAELYARFVSRQQEDPGWQPAPGLLSEMQAADTRLRISNAVSVKQYQLAERLLRENPQLLTCEHAWLGWPAVLAFAGVHDVQQATALAERLITKCNLPRSEVRDGLLRVANQAPPHVADAILARLSPALSLDLRRAMARRIALTRIADWSAQQTVEYERREREAGHEVNVEHLFPEIPPEQSVLDAVRLIESNVGWVGSNERYTLAWYFYNNGQPDEAVRYFAMAGPSETMQTRRDFALGETLSRIQARQFVEAEAVWPRLHSQGGPIPRTEASYPLAATNLVSHTRRRRDDPLYAGIWSLPADARTRIEQLAKDLNSADLFQQLGWLEQRKHNCGGAITWFEQALDTDPQHEEAAWGLANCYHAENKMAQLAALRLKWASASSRISGMVPDGVSTLYTLPDARPGSFDGMIYLPPVTGAALKELILKAPPPPPSLEDADETVAETTSTRRSSQGRSTRSSSSSGRSCQPGASPRNMSPRQAVAHGWCMLELNRPIEALAAFERAGRSSSQNTRAEAARGRDIALQRKGLSGAASAQVSQPAASSQASSGSLTDQAVAAHNAGQYRRAVDLFNQLAQQGRPMSLGLVVLRGWSYYNLGQRETARNLWRTAAQAGSSEAADALSKMGG